MFPAAISSWDANIHQWASSVGISFESFVQLLLAAIAGGLVGIEREVRGRQAGFRTYLLVSLGSALVMIVSVQFAQHRWIPQSEGVNINIDPARIAYGVMTGIGFLGAGVIVHAKGQVRGLTTAAGLWCVSAVGLAAGFGMYVLTILATVLILGALWILDYFEDMLPKLRYRTVTVRIRWEVGCIAQTVEMFRSLGMRVIDTSFDRSDDLQWANVNLRIAFVNVQQYYNIERRLEADPHYQLVGAHEV